MTIDWFVWFTPLILLPIVALFAFIGCDGEVGGPVYPGLMVKTANLYSTAWFRARWTFFKANSSLPLNDIVRPIPSPGKPGELVPDAAPGQPYQPPVVVEAKTTEPDFIDILALAPNLVQCECIVQDADPSKPSVKVKVMSGPEQQTFQKEEGATKIVWVLSRPNQLQQTWTLEPYLNT